MRIGKTREFAASAIEQICDIAPVPHCYEKTVRTNDGKRLYVWLLDAGEEHSVDVTEKSCIKECRELDKSFRECAESGGHNLPCVEDSLPCGYESLAAFADVHPEFVPALIDILADAGDEYFFDRFYDDPYTNDESERGEDGTVRIVRNGVTWTRGPDGKWTGPAADALADLLDKAAECVGE